MTTRQTAFEQFAQELGYPLDQEILVGGNYRGAVQHGNMVYVSGQLPRNGTQIMLPGRVADAASNMLQAVLGDAGIHTRTSVGVYQLPKNASVELNLTVAV